MRFARKLMLLAVAAVAALAMMAPVASASTPIEVTNASSVHCPAVAAGGGSGGCYIHAEGEATLFFHIFGIESTEATCHVEFEGRLNETGVGFITSYVSTNGGHGNTNCATVSPACAGSLPWPGAAEEDAGNQTTAHFDVCIDPVESGTCEGEFITDVTESGTEPERQHFQADDLRIGNAFCEVTIDVETEVDPVPPHQNVHIKSN